MSTKYHLINFSSGVQSAAIIPMVCDRYPDDEKHLIFADTLREHPDNYRFLGEVVNYIQKTYDKVFFHHQKDGRTVWEVLREARFVNHRKAMCSIKLKVEQCREIISQYPPELSTIYMGIGAESVDRERSKSIDKHWSPYQVVYPLFEWGHFTHAACLALINEIGIEPPKLYDYGFSHSNCYGACVRAGAAQWLMVYVLFPEEYLWHEEQEQLFIEENNASPPIIRRTISGEMSTISLRELREEYEEKKKRSGTLFNPEEFISNINGQVSIGEYELENARKQVHPKQKRPKTEQEQVQLMLPIEPCQCFTHPME